MEIINILQELKDWIGLILIPLAVFIWKIATILANVKLFFLESIRTDQDHETRIKKLEENCKSCSLSKSA